MLIYWLAIIIDDFWICLEMPKDQFEEKIAALNLKQPKIILNDWSDKMRINNAKMNNIGKASEFVESLIISIFPFLAIVFIIFNPNIRVNKIFLITLALFLLNIGPYLVLSWIPRYQSFQIGFFTIFIFMVVSSVISKSFKKSAYLSSLTN